MPKKTVLRPIAPETPRASRKRTAADPAEAVKAAKPKKPKLVRDSFTMPEAEYELISAVKRRCLAKGLAVKKSEVLRAAIVAFAARSDVTLVKALKTLIVVKTGRPPKAQE